MKVKLINTLGNSMRSSRSGFAMSVCSACLVLGTNAEATLISNFGTGNVTTAGGYNTGNTTGATLVENAASWTIEAPGSGVPDNGRGIFVASPIPYGGALATDFATISVRLTPGNTTGILTFETFTVGSGGAFSDFKQYLFDLSGANTSTFTTLQSIGVMGTIPSSPIGVFQIFKVPGNEVLGVEIASFGSVPEPSTALVSVLGFAALLSGRRRRSSGL